MLLHIPLVRGDTNLNRRMSHLVAFFDFLIIRLEIFSCLSQASHCKSEQSNVIQSVICALLPRPSSLLYLFLSLKMSRYSCVCIVNNITNKHPGTSSAIMWPADDRPLRKSVRGRSRSLCRESLFPTLLKSSSYNFIA